MMSNDQTHGLFPEFVALNITQDKCAKLDPTLDRRRVLDVLNTYFETVRNLRQGRGLANYTVDGSGCDL